MRLTTLVGIVATLAFLVAGTATADTVVVEPSVTGPGGVPLTIGNARDAEVRLAVLFDNDGDDEAESEILLLDGDLGGIEPGAANTVHLDVHFFRDDGSETHPNLSDPSSITDVRKAYAAVFVESDGDPDGGDDQSACVSTPMVW